MNKLKTILAGCAVMALGVGFLVAGLFLAVVAVYRAHERVGVGVLAGHLLDEVGDLLTTEHQGVEHGRFLDEPDDGPAFDEADRFGTGFHGRDDVHQSGVIAALTSDKDAWQPH